MQESSVAKTDDKSLHPMLFREKWRFIIKLASIWRDSKDTAWHMPKSIGDIGHTRTSYTTKNTENST